MGELDDLEMDRAAHHQDGDSAPRIRAGRAHLRRVAARNHKRPRWKQQLAIYRARKARDTDPPSGT